MGAGHGLVPFPQASERSAKIIMRRDVIGPGGECPRDEINGNIVFSHLMGDHTKQMQGDRLTGIGLQYLLVDALSFRQATRGVVLQSEV